MQNRFRCHDGWIAESSPAVANPCTCFYSDRSSPCLPTTTAITNTYASNGMTLSRVVSLSCLSNGQSRGANFFCVNIGEREELSCRYTFRFISSRRTLCTTDSGGYPVACIAYMVYERLRHRQQYCIPDTPPFWYTLRCWTERYPIIQWGIGSTKSLISRDPSGRILQR